MPRRRALMEPFTPEALRHHEPMVRRLTREYVDRFVDAGRADLVDELLWEVPLTVALHFLGIAEEDMDLLRKYSIAHTVNTWGRPRPEEQVAVAHAVGNFWQLAGKLLEKMRRDPDADGWMQYGIRKQKELPEVVTDSYLHSMMMAGIVAAHETTANAGANAIKLLLQHPHAWQELCEDPRLIPNAVEECLRHNGSVAAWRRVATRDVQDRRRRHPGRLQAPDRHLLGQPRRARLRRRRPVRHPARERQRPPHLRLRLAPVHGQEPGAHGDPGLPPGADAAPPAPEARRAALQLRRQHLVSRPRAPVGRMGPGAEPGARDAGACSRRRSPVRIGEPSKRDIARPVQVERVAPAADGIVRLRLVSPDGRDLPRWTPGSHIDVECGDTGLSRQYSLCGDPADARAFEIAVLREAESRGGSAWMHGAVPAGRPAARQRAAQPLPPRRIGAAADLHRRRHRHHADRGDGAARPRARHRLRPALQRPPARRHGPASTSSPALHGERLHLHVSEEGRRNDLAALLREPRRRHPGLRLRPGAHARRARRRLRPHWPEGSLRVEHFSTAKGKLDPTREHALRGRARRFRPGAAGARRPDPARRPARRQHRRAQRLRGRPVRLVRGRGAGRQDRPSRPRPHAGRARGRHADDGVLLARLRRRELVLGL